MKEFVLVGIIILSVLFGSIVGLAAYAQQKQTKEKIINTKNQAVINATAMTIGASLAIQSPSTPSDVLKLYDQKIPFDKLLQLIANQTAISKNHTPTSSETFLLNAISDEVRADSGEFLAGAGCVYGLPTITESSIRTCDQDASFIHEVCAQSNITSGVCSANDPFIAEVTEAYLQKRGISDPQTDAFAYFRLANILAKSDPSIFISDIFKIDLTKDGALKHFGRSK